MRRISSNLIMRYTHLREEGLTPPEAYAELSLLDISNRDKRRLEANYEYHLFFVNVETPETYTLLSPAE